MKELKSENLNQVSGGHPLAWGLASAYIYQQAGGAEGINRYLSNSAASAGASFRYWGRKISRLF
ncbi:hypothetical protein [Idiomarina sp.]|uniref:hypothetical protein n=1 Tax=Idiomarina sp. TaxID=1874361 RepID=UPI003A8D3D11